MILNVDNKSKSGIQLLYEYIFSNSEHVREAIWKESIQENVPDIDFVDEAELIVESITGFLEDIYNFTENTKERVHKADQMYIDEARTDSLKGYYCFGDKAKHLLQLLKGR